MPTVLSRRENSQWEAHRAARSRWIRWFLLAPVGALALAALGLLVGALAGGQFDAVFDQAGVKNLLDVWQGMLDAQGPRVGLAGLRLSFLGKFLILLSFLVIVLGVASGGLALALHDHFFPLYDGEPFEPIGPWDPGLGAHAALPWADGTELDAISRDLRRQLSDPAAIGNDAVSWRRPWGLPRPPVPFAHLQLLGRPGAGKSRLAEHLARSLGQREILGDAGRGAPAHPGAALTLSRGDARRRFWWFLQRLPNDPWDSGRIAGDVPGWFVDWRPARPTLLCLHDPNPATAIAWTRALAENASRYRFAVRLLIANQAMIPGLMTSLQFPVPVLLRGATYFDVPAITLLARKAKISPFDSAYAARVHVATEGNPLLVEIAFDYLRRGRSLSDMTRASLIEDRVTRICNALERADPLFHQIETLKAVALATLIGPDCPLRGALAAFPGAGLTRRALEAGFVSELRRGLDMSVNMPMIRPRMIGDAFLRWIAGQQEDAATEIAAAAFRLDPENWLCALPRLGRGADRVAEAMVALPPAIIETSIEYRERLAQALLTLGLYKWRQPQGIAEVVYGLLSTIPTEERSALAARLLAWHDALVTEDDRMRRDSTVRWDADIAAGKSAEQAFVAQDHDALDPASNRFVSGDGVAVIAPMLALAAFEMGRPAVWTAATLQPRLKFLIEWIRQTDRRTALYIQMPDILRWLSPMLDGDVDDRDRDVILRLLRQCRRDGGFTTDEGSVTMKGAGCSALRNIALNIDGPDAECFRLSADIWLRHADYPFLKQAFLELEELAGAPKHADNREMQLELVQGRRGRAYSLINGAPGHYREAIAAVEDIAGDPRYADDRDMQHERIRAQRYIVSVLKDDLPTSRQALAFVEAIVADPRYEDDRDMQYERAVARGDLAYAMGDDPDGRRAALTAVEEIVCQPRYAEDRDMKVEWARAFNCFAHTLINDRTECARAVAMLDAIAGEPRYIDDYDLLFARAVVRRYSAFSCRDEPSAFILAISQLEIVVKDGLKLTNIVDFAGQLHQARAYRG